MRVLIYYDLAHGAVMAFSLPAAPGAVPSRHEAPGGYRHRAVQQVRDKPAHRTWDQWAGYLAGRLPYGGRWGTEEVPDAWGQRPGWLAGALRQAQRRSQLDI